MRFIEGGGRCLTFSSTVCSLRTTSSSNWSGLVDERGIATKNTLLKNLLLVSASITVLRHSVPYQRNWLLER